MEKTDVKKFIRGSSDTNLREAVIEFADHSRRITFVAERVIYSQHQTIIIGRNQSLGRLMVIDNEVQFTEKDAPIYHELMAWPAMILRSGDNIAIYGGGDGLAAAEVLKFGVTPTIVDLDDRVIQVCREHFSDLNQGSLDKANIVIGDALQHRPKKKYDVILVDLTDQVACPFLYDKMAIAKYRGDLRKGGLILFYADVKMAPNFYGGLKDYFRYSFVYGEFLPFVISKFTFCLFSDQPINVSKLKRTRREGKYFCREHIHQIRFDHWPEMDFSETFSLVKPAEAAVKEV